MEDFVEISSETLYRAVFEACAKANVLLPASVYSALKEVQSEGLEPQSKMTQIFLNASVANSNSRPLCQDTGQVLVFAEVGQAVKLKGEDFKTVIQKAVADCYCENYFRKSVVEDALFGRINTQNNTPAIVYTDIVSGNEIRLKVLIKGGGAENMSAVKMFNPSATVQEISDYILETVKLSGTNACPPLFVGVGIGGTLDYAAVMSKKAYFKEEGSEFETELRNYINKNSETKCASVKVLTASTHIACMPVCVTLNCHSCRHAEVLIDANGKIVMLTEFETPNIEVVGSENIPEIKTDEVEKLRALKNGEEFYLTGEIYTARDAAHQRLLTILENNGSLPVEISDKIIFYAGPCPAKEGEVIGPIGPTTSKRMDKFAPTLYDSGLLATIGKGARSIEVRESIGKNNAVYLTVGGGVASYLQSCVKSAEVVAFEHLGPEAIYRLEVEKLPVCVAIGK